MKGTRLVLIPITVAWFTGGAWYMARQTSLGQFLNTAAPSPSRIPAIIHLGPVTDPIEAAVPSEDPAMVGEKPAAGTEAAFVPELTVRFGKNTNELQLAEEELAWCAAALAHLTSHPQSTITVTGYTDGDGDAEVNDRLSLVRAELVRSRLIELGAPADRIIALGKGAKEPISDNLTSKGKALNRRVEIHVMERP